MIQNAMFTSVWDDCIEIHSECFVDTDTHEVFDIGMVDVSDMDIDICTGEYITLPDGTDYDVVCNDNGYWFEF